MSDLSKLERIKKAIGAFVERNPSACDTADGIGRFWISTATEAELRLALEQLVSEGRLSRRTVGKRVHYGR